MELTSPAVITSYDSRSLVALAMAYYIYPDLLVLDGFFALDSVPIE